MLINKNAELTQCNEELLNKLNKYLDIPIVTMFYFMNHLHQHIIKLYLIYLMILHKTILYKQLYFYVTDAKRLISLRIVSYFFFDSSTLLIG